jgi:primosomal protein N' (replication factor Y)
LALGVELAKDVELLGPVPAPMERRAGRFRAQLLVQSRQRQALHGFLDAWIERLWQLKAARKVRWSLDVDPQDLL